MINSIRAGGSTNFVAVFEALGKIFKNEKKKDSTVPHYIFMMTDGEDTCNKTEEIENAKEHLQVAIEGFGGSTIFGYLLICKYPDSIIILTRKWYFESIKICICKKYRLFLQIQIWPIGEVIFNVLGFAEHHNEDFLESLALIGTSDGSYSFVSPKEGKKDISF